MVVQWFPQELAEQARKDGKAVHMAHGLFKTPINHEIGGTLLAKLPELLESGDIKVDHSSRLYLWLLRLTECIV